MAADTVPSRLLQQATSQPTHPAYWAKDSSGQYKPTTWREYAAQARTAGKALIAAGLEPGGRICVLGFNRPEWVVSAVGAMMAGGAPAGIYLTSSAPEIEYILGHSEAAVVVLETVEHWQKVERAIANLPRPPRIVAMAHANIADPRVMSWEAFLASGEGISDSQLDQRLAAIGNDDLATLIYTSGTTGSPKAVMLSHHNLAFVSSVTKDIATVRPDDVTLSYLPLAHIAEQVFTIHGAITNGYQVYFAESLAKLPDNLKEARPTVFFGVPRIWEKFHAAITARLATAPPLRKAIFKYASGVGARVNQLRNRGEKAGGLLALQYGLANKVVFSKLRAALGLDRARVCVSGAAPIATHVLEFFGSLDLTVHEVYGQSEDTGPTSFNVPGRTRLGTVGQVIPGGEMKIAEDGEVLVRGPHVFLGYFKDEVATNETLIDGWLHSGDLGEIDKDGFLRITGRKKELIITAGGKNIAPVAIEKELKKLSLVEEAVVIGDRRRYLTALFTLNAEAIGQVAPGLDVAKAAADSRVRDAIQKHIEAVNKGFATVETVKKFHVLPRPFTTDTGELTPSMKVKRKVVAEKYAKEIEAMYPPEEAMSI